MIDDPRRRDETSRDLDRLAPVANPDADDLAAALLGVSSLLGRLSFGRVALRGAGPQPQGWERRGRPPRLQDDEVHLWMGQRSDVHDDDLVGVLAPDEDARARSFHAPRDARRAAASAAVLRHVLGAYLGLSPGGVPLARAKGGKPLLLSDGHVLAFNLSHSADLILVAVSLRGPIGVDIEVLESAPPDPEQLAAAWFHEDEARDLQRIAPAERAARFLSVWTRKEAYGKARGDGLASSVGPGPRLDPSLPRQRLVGPDDRAWLCLDLGLPLAAAAALVVAHDG